MVRTVRRASTNFPYTSTHYTLHTPAHPTQYPGSASQWNILEELPYVAVCLSPPPIPSSPHPVSLASLLARSSEPCCSHVRAWWCRPLQAFSGISAPGPSASFTAEAPRSPHPCPARCSVSSSGSSAIRGGSAPPTSPPRCLLCSSGCEMPSIRTSIHITSSELHLELGLYTQPPGHLHVDGDRPLSLSAPRENSLSPRNLHFCRRHHHSPGCPRPTSRACSFPCSPNSVP